MTSGPATQISPSSPGAAVGAVRPLDPQVHAGAGMPTEPRRAPPIGEVEMIAAVSVQP